MVNVPATAPVFEKNPESEEDVLEGVVEIIVPVGSLVSVPGPEYPSVTDACAVGVAAPTVTTDVEGVVEEEC